MPATPNVVDAGVFRGRRFAERRVIISTGGAYTLSPDEALRGILDIQGALTSNLTVVFPQADGMIWIVANNTSGAFSVTCQVGASTQTVTQGKVAFCWTDGTTLYLIPTDTFGAGLERSLQGINHQTLTSASTTLTVAQAVKRFQYFEAASGGKSVVWPTAPFVAGDDWIVYNNSAFPVTLQFGNADPGTVIQRTQLLWIAVDPIGAADFTILGGFSDTFQDLIVGGRGAFGAPLQGLENGLQLLRVPSAPATSGTVALPKSSYEAFYVRITSALTGDLTITFPPSEGATWCIENATTGAHNLIAAQTNETGAGVTVAQGKRAIVSSFSTTMIRVTPDV